MAFEHLQWMYLAVPLLLIGAAVRFWRRHYWGHSLVQHLREEISGPNPILRLPAILEAAAVGLLLIALLGPIYPFVLNRIERGGLQIMIVLDLSQSMEEPLGKSTRMEAIKASTTEFIKRRPGDAIGLVVFSHNAYLVTPATFDHDSLLSYLKRVGTQTLVNEGYTAIGEGLGAAQDFFIFSRERGGRAKGEVQFPGLGGGAPVEPERGPAVGAAQAHDDAVPVREAHRFAHADRRKGTQVEGQRRLDVCHLHTDVIDHDRRLPVLADGATGRLAAL